MGGEGQVEKVDDLGEEAKNFVVWSKVKLEDDHMNSKRDLKTVWKKNLQNLLIRKVG